jgi:hypothetical protein
MILFRSKQSFFFGIRRQGILKMMLVVAMIYSAQSEAESVEAIARGRAFLTNLLDAELNLLPEYKGAKVYWLFHDNYLAAKVLAGTNAKLADKITSAIHHEGVTNSGKIEIVFGEAEKPLPFRHYELKEVRRVDEKLIKTEIVTEKPMAGWEQYADLLLLASMAEKDKTRAREHWDAAIQMWDGKGFMDAATRHNRIYSTYKLGLALMAANHLSPKVAPPSGLKEKLFHLQDASGGWITDYNAAGEKIGVANVETTCLAILGLEAADRL